MPGVFDYWYSRKEQSGYTNTNYGHDELLSRFFAYTTDIPDVCKRFNDDLGRVIEALPTIIDERTKAFVTDYIRVRMPMLSAEIKKYEDLVKLRDKYIQLLKDIDENELQRSQDNDDRKREIRTCIELFKTESIDEFSTYCSKTVNTNELIHLISTKGYKNKKEDMELFGSYLSSMLQEKCESLLKGKSDLLSQKTKDYIKSFSDDIKASFDKFKLDVDFDAGWAFVSALAGLGVIGRLASFAAGFGALAAGIFIFGGTVALTALGLGPLGVALGLLIAAALGIAKLFGFSWEKSVAKKIVALFEKKDISGQFRTHIRDYWKKTEEAFDKAADAFDKEWSAYVSKLRTIVESYDIEAIQRNLDWLKNLKVFFSNIPLSNTGSPESSNGTVEEK